MAVLEQRVKDSLVEVMRNAYKNNAVMGWSHIPKEQAEAMVIAVVEEYDRRVREQHVLDILDANP